MDNTRQTILALDDQPPILQRIVSTLKPLYTVKPFTSGQILLKYLESETADLIILDFEMPEMSGLEVLERLRQNNNTRGIPVIFLTGSVNDKTEVVVLEKGAADYILKPIKEQVLLTRVRLQLELARYRNHLMALVEEKTEKIKKRENVALNLLARATDMRDHETGGHIARTTAMVRIITNDLLENPAPGYTLTQQEADNINQSAKLHDLGKIAVPDKILLKPDKLDTDEFEIIKLHTINGAEMLDEQISQMGEDSFLDTARDIALYHHEKWNGKGYPYGISGESIPLSARITAIADVYDALNSARPYKTPFHHSKAVEIISADSGVHFDPYLVSIFLKHEAEFKEVVSSGL